ncbi:MAG TPA: metalloregulator ArsR/SmtB family transcription factor [Candidatus Synoicihabitans sp.]|nr:metalloregulator ArsR/SmtB family transcription factor [Candidatus Synoicihabitans sp.]
MDLIQIYQCLCDRTRLRILHLLCQGPLCVCHFQALLGEPQVKISKHLAYLKARGVVEAARDANWMIYRLPAKPSAELKRNLACLQDCTADDPAFQRDLTRWKKFAAKGDASPICGGAPLAPIPDERPRRRATNR